MCRVGGGEVLNGNVGLRGGGTEMATLTSN